KLVKSRGKKRVRIIVIPVSLVAFSLLALCLFLRFLRKNKKQQLAREGNVVTNPEQDCTKESRNEDLELPLFDLATLTDATNCFSINNKLGQGGFGPVYK
ncbi:hypothetical protein D5086_003551, partial [Populus alba]